MITTPLPVTTSGSRMIYPYVGPRPFEPSDRSLFFGRDAEINELLSLVISHRAVLFYAQSGAGKSSLVNAGLIPQLEKEGFEILPTARVQGLLKDTDPQTIDNLYIFNTILCLYGCLKKQIDHEHLKKRRLADFLAEIDRSTDQAGEKQARVLIFDQFEELFTFYPERWTDRTGFFEQVAEAIEADPLLRVVFTMREDYIAQLDPYVTQLPKNLRTRFRLERLRRDAALEAVTRPLKGTVRKFAPGVDQKLVDELMEVRVETEGGKTIVVNGEFVEPVQLQVVCQTLWRGLPPETITITEENLKRFGDVDNALSKFYERAIKATVEATGVKEGELRRWFEQKLLTPSGTRGTVYRGQQDTAGLGNQAVTELENMHILRGERRGGAAWYELTHDRFIDPILQSNRQWLSQRQSAEDSRQKFETKASAWAKGGRAGGLLLDETELREAQLWLVSKEAADLSHSETLIAFVEASQAAIDESNRKREIALANAKAEEQRHIAERERRRATQLKLAMISSLVFAILAGAFGVIAGLQKRTADNLRNQEQKARMAAEVARDEAEVARKVVEKQKAEIYEVVNEAALQEETQPKSSLTPPRSSPSPSPAATSTNPQPSTQSTQTAPAPTAIPVQSTQDASVPPRGFIYYGQRDGGGWRFQFLERENSPKDKIPAKGDRVIALQDIYARAGIIGKGRSTQKIGTVGKGKAIKIVNVDEQGNHVWIEFERP